MEFFKIDELGNPIFDIDYCTELLYQNKLNTCHTLEFCPNAEIDIFNKNCNNFDIKKLKKYSSIEISKKDFDCVLQSEWLIPEEYKKIDLKKYLFDKCKNKIETARVAEEYIEFEKRNLIPLLLYMIFLIDTLNKHSILWGVGRGSSVSSYILFLIGVHKINPIKYNLDWQEFLR